MPQKEWRWCRKCQSFFYSGNPSQGTCPADGQGHDASQSGKYVLDFGESSPGKKKQQFSDAKLPMQGGWRWCRKCQSLYFSENPLQGVCSSDKKPHDGTQSGHYAVSMEDSSTGFDIAHFGQKGWRWCYKCQSMFFSENPSKGVCPADHQPHDPGKSGKYVMLRELGPVSKPGPPPQILLAPSKGASQTGSITSVSRKEDHMEVFWIGGDGSVWDAHWYEGYTEWKRFQLAPPDMASRNGSITAVSRRQDHMEIFWIGGDGSVWAASLYDSLGPQWNKYQLAPPDMASRNGSITAVSRRQDHMEIFWIGGDGSVWAASLYDSLGPQWNKYQLAPPDMASRNGGITAVSRRQDHMEIFWIGGDGSVWAASFYDSLGPKWNKYQLAAPHAASQGGDIASVSRRQDHMEVFWIGGDGSVWAASFYDSLGPKWNKYQLAPPGSASQSGGIAAVSHDPNNMEVCWIAGNNAVRKAFWREGMQDWNRYLTISAEAAAWDGGVTAITRRPGHTDEFWIGEGGSVWATNSARLTVLPDGPVASGDNMEPGEILYPNNSIVSEDGRFTLVYQDDCNLVLYKKGVTKAFWSSKTQGQPAGTCVFQTDGNLVVLDLYGRAVWASNTYRKNSDRLIVQNDGNAVIYNRWKVAIWETGTWEKKEETPPVLESYDVKTLVLKGKNFRASHPVFVKLRVSGTITNRYRVVIPDRRETFVPLKFTSDAAGNLLAVIDPRSALPSITVDDVTGNVYGVMAGEQLHFTAHDERKNSKGDFLWSNELTITAP